MIAGRLNLASLHKTQLCMQLRRSDLTSIYLVTRFKPLQKAYLRHVFLVPSMWGDMGGTCDIAGRNRLDEDMGNRD